MLQFLVQFTATTMQRADKRNASRINYATLDAEGFNSAAVARVECPMCHIPDQPDVTIVTDGAIDIAYHLKPKPLQICHALTKAQHSGVQHAQR